MRQGWGVGGGGGGEEDPFPSFIYCAHTYLLAPTGAEGEEEREREELGKGFGVERFSGSPAGM